uniref:Galectin n=1 Tax=Malurus cyaneus samueli TaxID=2593467 RepID=A0A8C5TYQ7_9PASS
EPGWGGVTVGVSEGVPCPQDVRGTLAGPEDGADVALHLNPRFGGGVAVLNSRRGGHWGDERRRELHPFCAGSPFEIVINVTPEAYRILVNGTFFDEFPHRLPPEQVTAVTVSGDLELHSASVMGGGVRPKTTPDPNATQTPQTPNPPQNTPDPNRTPNPAPDPKPCPRPKPCPDPKIAPQTPPHVPKPHPNPPPHPKFIPNTTTPQIAPHPNHPKTQISPHGRGRCRGPETPSGGSWKGERELGCCSPFQRGRYFDLSIRCGNHRFKLFAEGQPLLEFHHRVPCGPHVDVLEIEGDVVLSFVHF